MTAPTSPIVVHPATTSGPARQFWGWNWAVRFIWTNLELAVVALAFRGTIPNVSSAWLVLGLIAAAWVYRWGVRRLRWMAWTEIPGAWSPAASVVPVPRVEVAFQLFLSTWTAALWVYLTITAQPGSLLPLCVSLGAGLLLAERARSGLAQMRQTHMHPFREALLWFAPVVTATAAALAGDPNVVSTGFLIGAVIGLAANLAAMASYGTARRDGGLT